MVGPGQLPSGVVPNDSEMQSQAPTSGVQSTVTAAAASSDAESPPELDVGPPSLSEVPLLEPELLEDPELPPPSVDGEPGLPPAEGQPAKATTEAVARRKFGARLRGNPSSTVPTTSRQSYTFPWPTVYASLPWLSQQFTYEPT
jgi:hypothetical protein